MILKHISTKVKRNQVYDCELWWGNKYVETIIGMSIYLKIFGLIWIEIKQYSISYNKK